MNAKTPFFLLLGMCFSFSVVLAIMLAMAPHPSFPKRRPAAGALRPAPAEPAPAPRRERAAPETSPRPEPAPAKRFDLTPSAIASQEIDQVKKELRQQITALKQDRDRLLDNLARQLKTLPAAEAAVQVEDLDDEAAILVLQRLPLDRRQAVLQRLEADRAARLSRGLRALATTSSP